MMNESNAEEMIDPRVAERENMETELKKLNENMTKLSRQVDEIQEELDRKNRPDKLGWDDVVQEIIGAITFSIPFLFTEEIWEIAKTIEIWRTLAIFLMTLFVAYLFISKSKLSNIEKEEWHRIPKRLLTVTTVSYMTSVLLIYIYGINNIANLSLGQYISATIIVSTFAVIGAIAVDLVK
ncbi:MAG: hypothetical protein PWP49_335 [Thermococcaceae archaeon]|nr:hypothetical protein [Thermococcaceae archaeon]MDK2853511.1 hypothetical protein [Thermococcaceae archaeon]MDK2983214.1 hypothetical protein [Thermococcaceae archaeon]MDN5319915.1 hypothetical protein [Thermococcaceae archaeon]